MLLVWVRFLFTLSNFTFIYNIYTHFIIPTYFQQKLYLDVLILNFMQNTLQKHSLLYFWKKISWNHKWDETTTFLKRLRKYWEKNEFDTYNIYFFVILIQRFVSLQQEVCLKKLNLPLRKIKFNLWWL